MPIIKNKIYITVGEKEALNIFNGNGFVYYMRDNKLVKITKYEEISEYKHGLFYI